MTRLSREHFGGYGGRIILQAFAAFTDDSHKLFTIFDDLASVPCVPFSTLSQHHPLPFRGIRDIRYRIGNTERKGLRILDLQDHFLSKMIIFSAPDFLKKNADSFSLVQELKMSTDTVQGPDPIIKE